MRRFRDRKGTTLLEVLLAASVLAVSLAVLAQLQSTGARAAVNAQLEMHAMALCQCEMDSWLSGVDRSLHESWTPLASSPGWCKRVRTTRLAKYKLSLLTIEIARKRHDAPMPVASLQRWVPTALQSTERGIAGALP